MDVEWKELYGEPPSHAELYRRWERSHWSVADVDLRTDAKQWRSLADADRARWFRLVSFSNFAMGESHAVRVFSRYLPHVPGAEAQVYLATQIADEARHVAFLARYFREVFADALPPNFREAPFGGVPSEPFRVLFHDVYDASDEEMRRQPSLEHLVRPLFTSHILLEGAVSTAEFKLLRTVLKRMAIFPGLVQGIDLLTRDEVRHFQFGMRLLLDLFAERPELREIAADQLDRMMPYLNQLLVPSPERRGALEQLDLDPWARRRAAFAAIRRHVARLGIRREIVDPILDAPAEAA